MTNLSFKERNAMKSLRLFGLSALLFAPVSLVAAEPKPAAPATVAHIKISGELDETPTADALFGAAKENLKAKLDRIKKAKDDPKVQALYLEIRELGIGFGKLGELRRAL